MAKFVLNSGKVSGAATDFTTISTDLSTTATEVSGYDISDSEGFDFGTALRAISSNLNDSVDKISNSSKLCDEVVQGHINLHNSLVFDLTIQAVTSAANDTLEVVGSGQEMPATNGTGANTETAVAEEIPNGEYTVVSGDSLSKIAMELGVSLASLVAANPQIENVNVIHPGDKIVIPSSSEKIGVNDNSGSEQKNKESIDKDSVSSEDKNINNSTVTTIDYKTRSVDGNRQVEGNSGYSVNEVLSKIKQECEKQGIGEYWKDACAISLWETGTYTSTAFTNNNVGGLTYADGETRYKFDTLDQGIEAYVFNLNKNYISQGLTSIDKMSGKYCPKTASSWANNVNTMKKQLERCL